MPVAGVDVGSVAAKAVVLDEEKKIVLGRAVLPTGWNSREAGEQVLQAACRAAGVEPAGLRRVVGTGYGRVALPFADKVVTEISCHARGASWLFPATGVVLDIGGQDSKVLNVYNYSDYIAEDTIPNFEKQSGIKVTYDVFDSDRLRLCTDGLTGKLSDSRLQAALGADMPLPELGQAAATGKPVSISSMCAVFAETEIIGLLAQGTAPADIAAGVYLSIARRMRGLAARIPLKGECTFTGGLATSPAFSGLLAAELGVPVNVPDDPQTVGALGAALVAAR